MEYIDSGYCFRFRYPPEWTPELDLRSDSTTYQHLLWLRAPGKPVEDVQLNIAFEGVGEDFGPGRTGIGSGDLVERRNVLSLEGTDMEVMYGQMGAVNAAPCALRSARITLARKGLV